MNKLEKVKIGVIGVGHMGENHCRKIAQLKNVEFIGIYDSDPLKCKKIANEFKIIPFSSYEELLQCIDAIIISTPTRTHFQYMALAIRANKHIFVEKPYVSSLNEAEQLKKLVIANPSSIIQVGHIERFNPAIIELNKLVETDKIISIEARRISIPDRQIDTDVIYDLMIHDIDCILQFVKSPISNIFAAGTTTDGQLDIASAILHFQNGIICTLVANRYSRIRSRVLTITEQERYIATNYLTKEIHIYQKPMKNKTYEIETVIDKVNVPYGDSLSLELEHFIECIRLKKSPLIGIDEAIRSLIVNDQIKNQINMDK